MRDKWVFQLNPLSAAWNVLDIKCSYSSGHGDDFPFFIVDNIKNVIQSLEEIGETFSISSIHEMNLNLDKCYLLLNKMEQTEEQKIYI